MALEIVWRNPNPVAKRGRRVNQIVSDEFGALYAVRTERETAAFEVIFGGTVGEKLRGVYASSFGRFHEDQYANR